jgi:epoxyqueuosine reductase QueG
MNVKGNAELTKQLKEAARQAGADLVGIASIDQFGDIAKEHHPASIFPEVKSVVVIGKRIARGCMRGVEEGTQFSLFDQYARNWLPDRFLALTTVTVATFLEDHRYEAVPLSNLPAQVPAMGIPVRPDAPAPNVMIDFYDAAVRAGLGEIGLNGEFMTPEFGPRQQIQMILTDADLVADPICETPVCDHCGKCIQICPLGSMNESSTKEIDICGKKMTVANVNWSACRNCKNGVWQNRYHSAGLPDRLAAICGRTCVHHLNESNRIKNHFQNPLRERPAWQVDAGGKTILVEDK